MTQLVSYILDYFLVYVITVSILLFASDKSCTSVQRKISKERETSRQRTRDMKYILARMEEATWILY